MRITYLLTTADMGAGTERTIFTQANWMSTRADTEILSVYRTAGRPHFTPHPRLRMRYIGVPAEDPRPSKVVPRTWDNQFDASIDGPLEQALRRLNADIVVTTTPALAYLVAKYAPASVRIIHEEHRYSKARNAGLEPLRLVADRLSTVAVLTERNRSFLRSDRAFDGTDIEVMPNPIEVGAFPVSSLSQPLIVGAGRFAAAKQFDHLVEAFALATAEHPLWRLRLFGRGAGKARIQAAIRRHGLESRVEIPGDAPDIEAHLAKASIFALASRSEALPMVLLESQAAGVPFVSYDTATGPREIADLTGGGIVVPMGSRHGLAAGLNRLIADDELRRDMGASARQSAWQFDTETIMDRWMRIFGRSSDGPRERASLEEAESPAVDECTGAGQSDPVERISAEFRARGIPFREATPLRGGGWRLVAQKEDGPSALAAVERAVDDGTVVVAKLHGDRLAPPWAAGESSPLLADAADEIMLWWATGERIGTVQLWTLRADGLRHQPVPDDGPAWVDESTWQKWLAAGTLTPSGAPYWNAHAFDIDVVYTWVDGDDPLWQERKRPFDANTDGAAGDAIRDARFRNRNELLYSVRSVRRFMPWVRNIYVVTDQQTPHRVLEEFPDVIVVDHRDIFPDPSVLPVFNSHAIEASIHRIPGLAEHYRLFRF